MDGPLVGGRVQRITLLAVAGVEVALLRVRVPPSADALHGENVNLVLAAGMGLGEVDGEGRGRLRDQRRGAPGPVQALWRATLEGGHIVAIDEGGFAAASGGRRWRASAGRARALELGEQGEVGVETAGIPREELAARGARILERLLAGSASGRREALLRALGKAIARLDRRIEAVSGDLERAQVAVADAGRARHFVSQAAQAPRGATRLFATDWSDGEANPVELALDPSRDAREQIDAMFKRGRRLKEGLRIMHARLADAQRTRATLAALVEAVAAIDDGAPVRGGHGDASDIDRIETRARAAAPRDFRLQTGDSVLVTQRVRQQAAPHAPFRTFLGALGARILVGRGAVHNDTLTFHVAKPHDLWLHAKNKTGAHVIVPQDKGTSCPAETLVEAAHLAAHFSDARDERLVEVQYAPRRHVRKPRGSAPGLVVVDREKVIVLRRQEDLLRHLLERETAGQVTG